MSPERRFLLLLTCAVSALVALGMATGRDGGSEPERSSRTGSARAGLSLTVLPARAATSGLLLSRTPLLRPLLEVRLTERFPRLASTVTPAPSPLRSNQILSYYGNPHSAEMGILGAAEPALVVAQLERHAEQYDRLNGPATVLPALHLVYAVAQSHSTDNGLYLQYLDDASVRRFLSLTEERGMLLFLDLQIGRSSVDAELAKVLPYLRFSHVHLALDPEFAVADAEVPGLDLGSLHARDIDRAQAALQRLVEAERLPPKLLIVHQFTDSMVLEGEAIGRYPDVELIIDMDGFGPAEVKRVKYQHYASRSYAAHAAIKLFFQHDPDLMSEEEVLRLEPQPAVVIYQ